MEIVAIVVQATLAAVAFWYAWETRRQRLQSGVQVALLTQQTAILREQARSAITPSLDLSVQPAPREGVRYEAQVRNPTDRVARDAWMFIYDSSTKSYLYSDGGHEMIEPQSEDSVFPFSGDYLSHTEAVNAVRGQHGNSFYPCLPSLEPAPLSFMWMTFFDISGRPTVVRRSFELTAGTVQYRAGRTYYGLEPTGDEP